MEMIAPKKKLQVDIWSDVACPWCYVGKRHLEAALEKFPERDSVEVTWRAFELDPSAPRANPDAPVVPYAERIAKKYGTSVQQAQERLEHLKQVGAKDGLELRLDKARPGNTFDAHRVIHFAARQGKQDEMKERLLKAYMTDGEAVSLPEVLVRLASEIGLEPQAVRAMLATDEGAQEVREEEAQAQELGIQGVPFFVIGRRYGISGAQPEEILLQALTRAWSELPAPAAVAEGAACGPDGC